MMNKINDFRCFISAIIQALDAWRSAGVFTCREDAPHPQVAAGQADDGGFVQLGGDGGGQRQQLGQLIKLTVLLLPARARRVL